MWSGGGLSSHSRVDAQGAMGAGPEASEVTGGQGRAGEKGMAQCDSGSVGGRGAHFAPRRSEIYVFPLEIRVPTRPGLERLIGHGQCPRSGQAGSM